MHVRWQAAREQRLARIHRGGFAIPSTIDLMETECTATLLGAIKTLISVQYN
jgi:hypothetical protein